MALEQGISLDDTPGHARMNDSRTSEKNIGSDHPNSQGVEVAHDGIDRARVSGASSGVAGDAASRPTDPSDPTAITSESRNQSARSGLLSSNPRLSRAVEEALSGMKHI